MINEDIYQIYQAIPHRPPFLFVDKIVEISKNRIKTTKYLRTEEPFFEGHYPGHPIMPGVLICESIFQSGAILISQKMSSADHGLPVLTRIQDVRFRRMVRPDEVLEIEVEVIQNISGVYFMKGRATVLSQTAVTVTFACKLIKTNADNQEGENK